MLPPKDPNYRQMMESVTYARPSKHMEAIPADDRGRETQAKASTAESAVGRHDRADSKTPVKRRSLKLLSLSDLDGRTRAAQSAYKAQSALVADLGGEGQLTEAQRQLVQRAACLDAMLEHFEAQFLIGEQFDLQSYLTAVNAQRRVLATIGLERKARSVTPDLHAYLNAKAQQQ